MFGVHMCTYVSVYSLYIVILVYSIEKHPYFSHKYIRKRMKLENLFYSFPFICIILFESHFYLYFNIVETNYNIISLLLFHIYNYKYFINKIIFFKIWFNM